MSIGLTNTLPRSSCGKCVKVLQELISGLDESKTKNNTSTEKSEYDPPPLTLLRAIARSSQNHPRHDQWGQEKRKSLEGNDNSTIKYLARSLSKDQTNNDNSKTNNSSDQNPTPMLTVEETENGVRLTIPVETTDPVAMKKWTHLQQKLLSSETETEKSKETNKNPEPSLLEEWMPLATSVRNDDDNDNPKIAKTPVAKPLTIELLCRRCENTGPEAGARAFLMGPQPLSIVLCHNRIDSETKEVEEILTHELVHLYDVQTLQLDLSDCETVAYSEVRAAREAECHKGVQDALKSKEDHAKAVNDYLDSDSTEASSTSGPGLVKQITQTLEKHVYTPYCVKKIALGATQNMFPSRGKACLNKVWEKAYNDHRPFGRTVQQQQQQQQQPRDWRSKESTSSFHDKDSGTVNGTSEK